MDEICDDILDDIRTQCELLNFVCAQRHNILEIWNNKYGRGIYEVKIESAQVVFYRFSDQIYCRKSIIKFGLIDFNVFEQINEFLGKTRTETYDVLC